jgi:hypothetical protein
MHYLMLFIYLFIYLFLFIYFCSFFLPSDCLGQSRAQVATELLAELNDDVTGNFVEEVRTY